MSYGIPQEELFVPLFPLRAQKLQSFHFFHPLLYARLPLPTRDNHINLLNFKDIISMSATSFPYPSFLGGLQLTYFCTREKACVWSGMYFHIVQKDVSLVMNIKKPSGELLYGNEINLLHPPQGCRLSWSIIFGWVGEPDIRQFLPISPPPICMDLFFSGALSLILYIHSIFNMLGNQTLVWRLISCNKGEGKRLLKIIKKKKKCWAIIVLLNKN